MEPAFQRQAIRRLLRRLTIVSGIAAWMAAGAPAQSTQKTLTWDEAKRELMAVNPTLRAAQIGIQESRADEITAYLRPNPELTVSADQFTPNPFTSDAFRPLSETLPLASGSYLVERQHKRSLRRESARGATAIA